jgi:eukaryotic-like serine/threonine-protein kinase
MPAESASSERRDTAFPKALGKYVPFARLGSGGMAEVFLSVAPGPMGFNKLAVLKRLKSPDDIAHVKMFLDEARLAARLNHPNIVHTYEVGETDGYFIAMEYLEGQSLQALLTRLAARREGLSEPLVAYIAAQVLKGLHHAHELCDFDGTPIGIVHRDVSPQNLYLTYGGEVKVLDFGIAKARMNAAHTETGVLKGKVRYMAPEQLGSHGVDRRADIFAFGVVLWELLARRALFQGDAASVMARLVNEDLSPVREVRPEASPELDIITMKALRRDPNERYATADEMRIALEDFLRVTGHLDVDRELGRLMNELFAQTRDEVRGRVKEFLQKLSSGNAGTRGTGRTRDLPILIEGSEPQTPPATSGTAVVPKRVPRWSWLLLVVGIAVVGVVGLARLGRQIENAPAASPGTMAPSPSGHLRLETIPAGAVVERDGKVVDRAPMAVDLQPGTATFRVSLDGYEAETIALDVAPGATIDRTVALRPLPSPPLTASAKGPEMGGVPAQTLRPHPVPREAASQKSRIKVRVLDDDDSQ